MKKWVFCSRCMAYHDEMDPTDSCPEANRDGALVWIILLVVIVLGIALVLLGRYSIASAFG